MNTQPIHVTISNHNHVDSCYTVSNQEMQLAQSEETTGFFKELGGVNIDTPYGFKSISPKKQTIAYWGNLNNMPKRVQKLTHKYLAE